MSRKLARELCFKILFAIDAGGNTIDEAFKIAVDKPLNEDAKVFMLNEVNGVLERKEQIDDIIDDYSIDWRLERLNVADRNILRIAIYEMFFCDDIPLSVSINEAVEIAKKYGDKKSPKFINGILGAIARDLERLRPKFSV